MLVQELLALVNQHSRKPISQQVQGHVHEYLVDISDIIWAHPEKASTWLTRLSKEPIFPVANTQNETVLQTADQYFYIPDRSGRYQAVFANRVALLCTVENASLESIRPILESDTFKTRLRYLDMVATHVCLPKGPREVQNPISEKYAQAAHYIER